jgi:hypothetical protein
VLPLLLASAAQAASNTAAQTYLIAVSRLYESLEYERALDQIHLARQGPRSTEEEVTLSLYEGIILVELNQQEQGLAAFKSALLLQPEAKLPVRVSPKVETLFESVRKKVKRELAAVLPKYEAERRQADASPQPQARPEPSPIAAPTAVSSTAPTGRDLRQYALFPAVAGGTLMMAGGISWAFSRTELNHLRGNAPHLATQEDVQRTISRGRTWQTVGVSLLGVGVAGLATAAGLYVVGSPSTPVALGVSTEGNSVLVYGRWP